jgi:hypothetical protein
MLLIRSEKFSCFVAARVPLSGFLGINGRTTATNNDREICSQLQFSQRLLASCNLFRGGNGLYNLGGIDSHRGGDAFHGNGGPVTVLESSLACCAPNQGCARRCTRAVRPGPGMTAGTPALSLRAHFLEHLDCGQQRLTHQRRPDISREVQQSLRQFILGPALIAREAQMQLQLRIAAGGSV